MCTDVGQMFCAPDFYVPEVSVVSIPFPIEVHIQWSAMPNQE